MTNEHEDIPVTVQEILADQGCGKPVLQTLNLHPLERFPDILVLEALAKGGSPVQCLVSRRWILDWMRKQIRHLDPSVEDHILATLEKIQEGISEESKA